MKRKHLSEFSLLVQKHLQSEDPRLEALVDELLDRVPEGVTDVVGHLRRLSPTEVMNLLVRMRRLDAVVQAKEQDHKLIEVPDLDSILKDI